MKHKPVATEYKGVRYKSKCEAMFAMELDLRLLFSADFWSCKGKGRRITIAGVGGFQYEPETFVDGWNPDFLTWDIRNPHNDRQSDYWCVPIIYYEIIEYKPTKPTKTYIDNFCFNCEKWVEIAEQKAVDLTWRTSFKIYFGNPFSENRDNGIGYVEIDVSQGEAVYYIIEEDWWINREEILEYRFDLPEHANE